MLKTIDLAKGAHKLINLCGNVQPGENVLILTDTGMDFDIAHSLAIAAAAVGAEPSILITQPGKKAGEEPNPIVARAMEGADIIFAPTTRTVFHSQAAKAAAASGSRLLTLTEITPQSLVSGGIEADFLGVQDKIRKLKEIFEEGSKVHITTEAGTDLYLDISGRSPWACNGLCHEPGDMIGIPDLEVFIAPIESYTYGKIVFDVTMAGYGFIKDPIEVSVQNGRAVSIKGGVEADALSESLAAADSPNAYNIVEIGIGMNDKGKLVGDIIEDEGVYGTGHFAFGNNLFFGGENESSIHLDIVYMAPTIEVDGVVIMQNGQLL